MKNMKYLTCLCRNVQKSQKAGLLSAGLGVLGRGCAQQSLLILTGSGGARGRERSRGETRRLHPTFYSRTPPLCDVCRGGASLWSLLSPHLHLLYCYCE